MAGLRERECILESKSGLNQNKTKHVILKNFAVNETISTGVDCLRFCVGSIKSVMKLAYVIVVICTASFSLQDKNPSEEFPQTSSKQLHFG